MLLFSIFFFFLLGLQELRKSERDYVKQNQIFDTNTINICEFLYVKVEEEFEAFVFIFPQIQKKYIQRLFDY